MPLEIALNIDYNSNYYRTIAAGVARYSTQRNWRFFTSRGVPQISSRDLKKWEGAGVIGPLSPDLIEDLQQRGIPAVNIKSDFLDLPVASVLMDNLAIGRLAAEFLLEKGIRRFAATSWSIRGASGKLKVRGFVETLKTRGFGVTLLETRKSLQDPNRSLRGLRGETVGLFAAEDFLGRIFLEACADSGLRSPEDVAVIGVDNSPFICEMLTPTMSSIELGAERVGYQAAALLERMIQGEPIPADAILVQPERIEERQSSELLEVQNEVLTSALRFIQRNVSEAISVSHVAEAVFCSRRALEIRFKTDLGRTIHEEIRRYRIEHACKLLRESDMLIESLAESCGYNSRERFNAAFRQEKGTTPSAYRKDYRFMD